MPSTKESLSLMKLTQKDCALIMDNCFTGLFVTDGVGRIIYVNHDALDTLGVSASEVLNMDIYQLHDLNFTSYSSTAEVLKTGKRVIGAYKNKAGDDVAVVSTPVYGDDHKISMVVTYSHKQSSLNRFNEELARINSRLKRYEATLDYLENNSSVNMVAEEPSMRYILNTLSTLADTDSTIIIYGESGVGKEVIANYIYQHSRRKEPDRI